MPKMLDVTHISKVGSSFRITLPLIVRQKLMIRDGDILAFYEENEDVFIKKVD